MICKCNKLIFGLLLGLVLPPITAYVIYLLQYKGQYGFYDFMQGLIILKSLGKLISISALPNLAVFMIFVTYEKLLIARGMVIMTFVWVLAVLAIRFLL